MNTATTCFLLLFVPASLRFLAPPAVAQKNVTSQHDHTSVRQGPQVMKAGDHGVGKMLPDVVFTDLRGTQQKLSKLVKDKTLVVAMTSTSCPLSKKYLPTLVELVRDSGSEVVWLIVNPIATDNSDDMKSAAEQFAHNAIYVSDPDGHVAKQIGALTTTDVIVTDSSRTVMYHGAIDDQYGFGYSLDAPRNRYLAEALEAIETGDTPAVAATDAPGCTLDHSALGANAPTADITYHNRISRLMQRHCVECHRSDGVAPFSLTTFAEVTAHAGMIEQVVQRGVMPPWFAEERSADGAEKAAHSLWANDRSLAAAEEQDLLTWLANGRPEGDPRNTPLPRKFADGWLIGKPDAVFQFVKPVPVKATGVMPYKDIVVETNLPDDRWVQAIEVKPGNRSVVHHVLIFVIGAGNVVADERDGYWGIYVPGNSTLVYPDGFAKRLPKNAKLRFQMHYTPNGTATTDQTSVGLVFAKAQPKHEVRVAGIVNSKLRIPPGAANHREVATLGVPADSVVLGFLPHMHLRGKACRYEVTTVAGDTKTLLDIPRYDFNWQLLYRYREPLPLQAGDTLKFTAWFDNSSNNPANPDPTKTVRWGPQTFDEMQLGYVEYYVPGESIDSSVGSSTNRSATTRRAKRNMALFARLDVNNDDHVTKAEVRERMPNNPDAAGPIFDRLDEDKDGKLTRSELSKL